MNWLNGQIITWRAPLLFAEAYKNQPMALLYSGMQEAGTGRYSYLLLHPLTAAEGEDWDDLPDMVPTRDAKDAPLPDWVGYLGYEMGEDTPRQEPRLPHPNFRLVRYAICYRFDHVAEIIEPFTRGDVALPQPMPQIGGVTLSTHVTALSSNFSRLRYEQTIADTVAHIEAGDFYQANITRKFFGTLAAEPDSFALFTKLAEASPAPYSAYISHGDSAILSASPECFLSVEPTGRIVTRPIKGSARRGATEAEDATIKTALARSEKNHAENLMIVDLMRNDLARVSQPESVRVEEQSGLYSYATIHHLISTVSAQMLPETTVTDVIRACFPPGSMTGAPKIAAMKWCAREEQLARSVYSGAIGWLSDAACSLSVVIRTLLLQGNQFEFQVGGGIVADSTPEEEWRETLTKARGICLALGISETELAEI